MTTRIVLGALALICMSACSGSTPGGATGGEGRNTGDAELSTMHYGRLVDVYGLRTIEDGVIVDLVETDVMIGPDIQDQRGPSSDLRDDEIEFDFLSANPDNLQPRLLIPREVGSEEFDAAFAKLGARLRPIAAGLFGQDVTRTPFSVVPRNGALLLTFSQPLGIDDTFFVNRDENGTITGLRNTEAVQLLEITGDPTDGNHDRDFRVIPARVVVDRNRIILDPVLLGTEGLQHQTRNNASGLPESPDQLGANIRIAIATEGPLRIPGVHSPEGSAFVGRNNSGQLSIVRDFRSGNRRDHTPYASRGFVRDSEPPRIVGELLLLLERVDRQNEANLAVTIYKNERVHELDRGDVIRFIDPRTDEVIGASEILADPVEDFADPGAQHVRAVVRAVPGLEDIDPANDPDYPRDLAEREVWLRENGPRVVLVSEYTSSRIDPRSGRVYGDDPANFVAFSPSPLPLAGGNPSPPTENISPFASAIVRFTKPVDMATVRAADSFFIATRNVLDDAVIEQEFLVPNGIDPGQFNYDKFITPHLVASRVIDEDGSQTAIRLQPVRGLYLDDEMREIDEPLAFAHKRFKYFLHLLGDSRGIKDLAGNWIDFQAQSGTQEFLAIPFSLDTRTGNDGQPAFGDNLVVSLVRRFADPDEDEQPSLYRQDERPVVGQPVPFIQDLFGAVSLLSDGTLEARPTTRITRVVDDLNQQAPPSQSSDLRFCPVSINGQAQIANATGGVKFGGLVQNPLNPWGARLQTVWREIDMSLSRVDAFDFNLDVEQMYWAPFTTGTITYDQFDRVSLFLGHSEFRPEPCVGAGNALPTMQGSGLGLTFAENYVNNLDPETGLRESAPDPHPAYLDRVLTVDPNLAIKEPNGINRFLPLPDFEEPHFVWRDETVVEQGGVSGVGSDVDPAAGVTPYIISPFLNGQGVARPGFWNNFAQFSLRRRLTNPPADRRSGGLLGTVALPLLADFWTYCDDPVLPEGNGFRATGFNGWQIALAVQSSWLPNFRAYSGGFAGVNGLPSVCVDPSTQAWVRAVGGYQLSGQPTVHQADNSVYWVMADYLKRQTVVTFGFVDLLDPHRMPGRAQASGDPRLGPYFSDAEGNSDLPSRVLPDYDWMFEPPLEDLPPGTAIVPEFRAASTVARNPWYWPIWRLPLGLIRPPDAVNVPLDPLKAGDAHIRKLDDHLLDGVPRNYWTYFYTEHLTRYTTEIEDLARDEFTNRFSGPRESFNARDVRLFNWRFIMRNNAAANPPVSPVIDSFAITYRFQRR